MEDLNKTVVIAHGQHAVATPPPSYQQSEIDDALVIDAEDDQISQLNPNPLLRFSYPLFAILADIRGRSRQQDSHSLFRQLAQLISRFEQNIKQAGVRAEHVLASRYAICTVLDEAILTTHWGRESGWQRHTLLSYFHKETFGGSKFFLILEKLLQQPAQNVHQLEFIYFCLSYGFQGKYRLEPHGQDQVQRIRSELYQLLQTFRPQQIQPLSPKLAPSERQQQRLKRRVPLWLVSGFVVMLTITSFFGFRYWASQDAIPVQQHLQQLLTPSTATVQPEVAGG